MSSNQRGVSDQASGSRRQREQTTPPRSPVRRRLNGGPGNEDEIAQFEAFQFEPDHDEAMAEPARVSLSPGIAPDFGALFSFEPSVSAETMMSDEEEQISTTNAVREDTPRREGSPAPGSESSADWGRGSEGRSSARRQGSPAPGSESSAEWRRGTEGRSSARRQGSPASRSESSAERRRGSEGRLSPGAEGEMQADPPDDYPGAEPAQEGEDEAPPDVVDPAPGADNVRDEHEDRRFPAEIRDYDHPAEKVAAEADVDSVTAWSRNPGELFRDIGTDGTMLTLRSVLRRYDSNWKSRLSVDYTQCLELRPRSVTPGVRNQNVIGLGNFSNIGKRETVQ